MGFFARLGQESYDRKYSDRELARRLAPFFRPYRKELLTAAGLMFFASLMASGTTLLFGALVDVMAARPSWPAMLGVAGGLLAMGVLLWAAQWGRRRVLVRVLSGVVYDLFMAAFRAVMRHDLSFFDRHASGRVASRLLNDTREIAQVASLVSDILTQFLFALMLIFVLLVIDWRYTLLTLFFAGLLLALAYTLRKWARKVTLAGLRALAGVNAAIKETVSGIQVAKNFRREMDVYREFDRANQDSYRVNLTRGYVLSSAFPILNFAIGLATAGLIVAGGWGVYRNALTPGELMLFLRGLERFWFPIINLASFWTQVQAGLAAAERVFSLMDVPPQVHQEAEEPVPQLRGDIRFEHVDFAYEPGKPVLQDFNLHIPSGQTLALVGHTGAGKTSIVRLIARLYEFQGGRIRVDGRDLRRLNLREYRRHLGYVPQHPFLFSGTVLENIRYARPEATEEEVLDLARRIDQGRWLHTLPDGLYTQVGERGHNLSMGQRQLVALLRVLLQRPAIFLLDEATASIDPFTERQIQEALGYILAGSTSILIAHRLFTVVAADRIIVLEKGRIIEEGDHASLMARGGHYAHLFRTYFYHQTLHYIEEVGRKLAGANGPTADQSPQPANGRPRTTDH